MATIHYQPGLSIDEVRGRSKASKIHKLSSNENPRGPSPLVVTAIQTAATTLNSYPPRGDESLRQALVTTYQRALTLEHFFCANSGSEVLQSICRTFLQPGDDYLICSPTFGAYVRFAGAQGANAIDVPLRAGDFSYDIDAILAAVTERTRLFFLCNPNNPTGTIMPASDFATLLARLPAHVTVVADQVYEHYVTRADFPDTIADVLAGKPIIIVNTFSKGYGLAGLRLGYAVASPAHTAQLRRQVRNFHLSSIALAAGVAALADQAYMHESARLATEGKDYLYGELERLNVQTWPSEGNFLLIRPDLPAQQVHDGLLTRGVMVRPMDTFGYPEGLRVTVGSTEANAAFIAALEEVLQEGQSS
ncbi:MAG: aminotransferase class I/II-fold pyridoxal phosphate-dependent enzyme [Caldilineaceae bacterium]|nr:aminotransferase class I/II-fold pyridoxal phosphate-dependent enzyme [Caldilineaceae bacterium]